MCTVYIHSLGLYYPVSGQVEYIVLTNDIFHRIGRFSFLCPKLRTTTTWTKQNLFAENKTRNLNCMNNKKDNIQRFTRRKLKQIIILNIIIIKKIVAGVTIISIQWKLWKECKHLSAYLECANIFRNFWFCIDLHVDTFWIIWADRNSFGNHILLKKDKHFNFSVECVPWKFVGRLCEPNPLIFGFVHQLSDTSGCR